MTEVSQTVRSLLRVMPLAAVLSEILHCLVVDLCIWDLAYSKMRSLNIDHLYQGTERTTSASDQIVSVVGNLGDTHPSSYQL